MEKWEELFPQNTRKKGRELLETKRELADRIIGQGTEQAAPMTGEDMLRLLEIRT